MNRRVLTLAAFFVLAFLGCGRPPQIREEIDDQETKSRSARQFLDLASDSLREGTKASLVEQINSVHARDVVKDLNDYLRALRSEKPNGRAQVSEKPNTKLSPSQRSFLEKQLHLEPAELNELDKTSFTMLDGHYLETCALLSGVVDALDVRDLPLLERARTAFDWVIHQVNLKERVRPGNQGPLEEDSLIPPALVAKIGFGTAKERALLFLAVLQQLGVEGCMIACPGKNQERMDYWIPGVLIPDGEKDPAGLKVSGGIYLFDTRLGMPLPGPDGHGIARLDQVMRKPDPIRSWFGARAAHVIPKQIHAAEVHLACPLSALSPRMRLLQKEWVAGKITFAVVPEKLLHDFQKATKAPVRFWNAPGDPNTPTRVLRVFLSKETAGNAGQRRPNWLAAIVPVQLVDSRYPAELHPRLHTRLNLRVLNYFESILNARNLLVRGRVEEATRVLVHSRDRLQEKRTEFLEETNTEVKRKELTQAVKVWCESLADAVDNLLNLQEQAKEPNQNNMDLPNQLSTAQKKVNALLSEGREMNYIAYRATADLVGKEAAYLLCLCMQEKAGSAQVQVVRRAIAGKAALGRAREEAQGAWGDASDAWSKSFINPYALTTPTLDARLRELATVTNQALGDQKFMRAAVALYECLELDLSRTVAAHIALARALAHQGQRDRAVAGLQTLVNTLDDWDKKSYFKQLSLILSAKNNFRAAMEETAATSPENALWLRIAAEAWLKRIKQQTLQPLPRDHP